MATEKRLIDASELHSVLEEIEQSYLESDTMSGNFAAEVIKMVQRILAELPTVDAVEVVHGRWVLTANEEHCNCRWNVTAECSECHLNKGEVWAGFFPGFPKELAEDVALENAEKVKLDNYCPNCGAKMDGDGNG